MLKALAGRSSNGSGTSSTRGVVNDPQAESGTGVDDELLLQKMKERGDLNDTDRTTTCGSHHLNNHELRDDDSEVLYGGVEPNSDKRLTSWFSEWCWCGPRGSIGVNIPELHPFANELSDGSAEKEEASKQPVTQYRLMAASRAPPSERPVAIPPPQSDQAENAGTPAAVPGKSKSIESEGIKEDESASPVSPLAAVTGLQRMAGILCTPSPEFVIFEDLGPENIERSEHEALPVSFAFEPDSLPSDFMPATATVAKLPRSQLSTELVAPSAPVAPDQERCEKHLLYSPGVSSTTDSAHTVSQEDRVAANLAFIYNEIKHFSTEEQLIKAWVLGETCLRLSKMPEADHAKPEVDKQMKIFAQKLLADPQYQDVSSKIRMLLDILEMFGLVDRFNFVEWGQVMRDYDTLLANLTNFSMRYSGALSYSCSGRGTLEGGLPRSPSYGHFHGGAGTVSLGGGFRLSTVGTSVRQSLSRLSRKRSLHDSNQPHGVGSGQSSGQLHQSQQQQQQPHPHRRFLFRSRSHQRGGGKTPVGGGGVTPTAAGGAQWVNEAQKGMRLAHKVNQNGSISIRLKVKLRTPLFKVLAILNEIDYFDKWMPYCKNVNNLAQVSRASMLLQQFYEYPWPIKAKEAIGYCFGVDLLDEFDCVLIASYGVSETVKNIMGREIPAPQKKVPRIPSSHTLFLLYPVDDGEATVVELFANIDPGISSSLKSVVIPVLKIIVVRTVKSFFHKIGLMATNFAAFGYEKKVQENAEFYAWIQERIDLGVRERRFNRACSMTTLLFEELATKEA